ncbi:hypothetical protein N7468_008751 [Penicillium chermesinum]|uniref:Uncharacterized protein n=1 Tax=Penicillium chermesinum TaxID=63820 RepID=A0A9W9NGK4_9EURO|nr:uncharacterized protein N7468_008751 [Penicillium chermesinum]KAJ5219547.1 hypothetical protein N7468_008751 [Penicillium chermesinum]
MKHLASLLLLAATAAATQALKPFYLKTTSNTTDDSFYVDVDNINTSESYAMLTKDHNSALPFFWGMGATTRFNPYKASRVMITDHAQGPDFTVDEEGNVGTTNPSFDGWLAAGDSPSEFFTFAPGSSVPHQAQHYHK